MTRQFVVAAIVIMLAKSLPADEPSVGQSDLEPAAVETNQGDEEFFKPKAESQLASSERKQPTHSTFADQISQSSPEFVIFDPIAPPTDDSCNGCGFHCVHDNPCRLCSMYPCVCETTCCTTDQWMCHPCQCSHGNCYRNESGEWVCNDGMCDVWDRPEYPVFEALRLGYWGVSHQGALTKTGEFQDLDASPFWDFDTIRSNGSETLDLTLTGLDNEANDARAVFYGRGKKANVRFQRYLRRLDHDPPAGFISTPPGPPDPGPADDVVTTDLNLGQDYAIRVDQLDARFQGRVTDNVKWRLNLWGMRKFGERQANATAHCFNFNAPGAPGPDDVVCHVQSRRQTIDWLTMEIQPVVEAQVGTTTIEYSRTMRAFGQADEVVTRQYTRFNFSPANNVLGPEFSYAVTPENFTQIDRLKVFAPLNECNQLYANLYHGDTHNEFRDTHRQFSGWDVRLMNIAREDLTLTVYTSMYDENNEVPTVFFNAPPLSSANNYDELSIRHPVDYQRTRFGVNGRWRPYYDEPSAWRNLSWAAGYEYYLIARDFATYDSARLGIFTQPDSNTHQFELGPSMKWSPALSTYVKYKAAFTDVPLIGVRESTGRLNTNQPEQQHWIDIGGNWAPAENFIATAQFSVVNSWHDSNFARFNEDSYPLTLTMWYAPSDRWSFTTGYAYLTNWIDQEIAIGFRTTPIDRLQADYDGENHVASVNAFYILTPTVQLTGGYEFNRGTNAFTVSPAVTATGADWSQLGTFSDVVVNTHRLTAGVDWQTAPNMDVYLRYNYFDYADEGADVDSGTAHMALAGATFTR